jgi:hypothetical protein
VKEVQGGQAVWGDAQDREKRREREYKKSNISGMFFMF